VVVRGGTRSPREARVHRAPGGPELARVEPAELAGRQATAGDARPRAVRVRMPGPVTASAGARARLPHAPQAHVRQEPATEPGGPGVRLAPGRVPETSAIPPGVPLVTASAVTGARRQTGLAGLPGPRRTVTPAAVRDPRPVMTSATGPREAMPPGAVPAERRGPSQAATPEARPSPRRLGRAGTRPATDPTAHGIATAMTGLLPPATAATGPTTGALAPHPAPRAPRPATGIATGETAPASGPAAAGQVAAEPTPGRPVPPTGAAPAAEARGRVRQARQAARTVHLLTAPPVLPPTGPPGTARHALPLIAPHGLPRIVLLRIARTGLLRIAHHVPLLIGQPQIARTGLLRTGQPQTARTGLPRIGRHAVAIRVALLPDRPARGPGKDRRVTAVVTAHRRQAADAKATAARSVRPAGPGPGPAKDAIPEGRASMVRPRPASRARPVPAYPTRLPPTSSIQKLGLS
jgi:hypothetical protein